MNELSTLHKVKLIGVAILQPRSFKKQLEIYVLLTCKLRKKTPVGPDDQKKKPTTRAIKLRVEFYSIHYILTSTSDKNPNTKTYINIQNNISKEDLCILVHPFLLKCKHHTMPVT